MKNVFYYNPAQFNGKLADIRKAATLLQSLVDEYNKLDIGPLSNKGALESLMLSKSSYCRSIIKLSMEPVKVKAGQRTYTARPDAVLDTMELPDFSEVERLATECSAEARIHMRFLDYDGKKVTIPESCIEQLRKESSILADTPKKLKLLEAVRDAEKALDAVQKAVAGINGFGIVQENTFGDMFRAYKGEVKINDYYFVLNSKLLGN